MHNPGHSHRDLNRSIRESATGCGSVIEFGCMFGDRLAVVDAPTKIGVEIHGPYLDACKSEAIIRIQGDARSVVKDFAKKSVDLVLLVDFVEHLEATEAAAFIRECQRIARKRVVLFVPEGNHPQTTDVFGMGADHWQTHRSSWTVSDLADLGFDVALWRNYHSEAGKDSGAMFAVWEPVRCSIVMSTYNKADALDLSIQSIKQQDVPFNYEIIVVDDGSSDHTRTVCRRHWVRYAHLDRPFYCNPAKARNIAFKMALGDVLIHQCEVIHHTPNSISLLVERLQAGHLEFATVYNATIAGSDPIQTPPHAPFVAVSKGEMYSGPANQRPFFFLGAAFREDIFAAGGYDEDFVGLGYDDNWLADCLTQGRGLKPRFWGDVIAWHLDHPRPDWVYSSQAEMRKLWERKLAIGQFVSSSGPWSFY